MAYDINVTECCEHKHTIIKPCSRLSNADMGHAYSRVPMKHEVFQFQTFTLSYCSFWQDV